MTCKEGLKISDKFTCPLLLPKIKEPEKKRDPVKMTAIITAVAGGIIAAIAALCIVGIFPRELLGGTLGIGITVILGLGLLVPSVYVIFKRWND